MAEVTWTNAGLLLIGPVGTNFSEILIGIQIFSLKENAIANVVCEMAAILFSHYNAVCNILLWWIVISRIAVVSNMLIITPDQMRIYHMYL